MKDYRFRGKRLDNGEWVYGCLIYDNVQTRIATDLTQYNSQYCDCKSVEVDPETVGQFTGLLDRHGKEIYEGDKLKDEFLNYDNKGYWVVFWDKENARWRLKGSDGRYYIQLGDHSCLDLEIIGTIHDQKAEV